MKTKISFTSVLKSKSSNRQLNGSSTYSTQSQYRPQRLIDIFQEFQQNPDKQYTLNLNAFKNINHRSRNGSINMIKSKNTYQDPQMDLQTWIEKQKRQNYQSSTKFSSQQGFRQVLRVMPQNSINKRSKSNFNKNFIYPEQQSYEEQSNYYHPTNMMMEGSKQYKNAQLEQSNKPPQRSIQKSPIQYRSHNTQVQQIKAIQPKEQTQQNPKISPEQYFASQKLQSKSYYPGLEEQQYQKLNQQFQRLKSQKISELCMQVKKSIKKEKLQQIISKTLQNIYEDIQQMAEQMIIQRKKRSISSKKQISQQQISEQMLISGANAQSYANQMSKSEEQRQRYSQERRQQEMRNKIKDYLTGIQQAKNQSKTSTNFHQSKGYQKQQFNNYSSKGSELRQQAHQQHSFNDHNSTFNTHINNTFNNYEHHNEVQADLKNNDSMTKCSTPLDSVGYSFANSNMVCQHSFNKQLMGHNNFHNENNIDEMNFQKNNVKPPIYEPQNSDNEEEQRISLPNIQQVKSESGDFPQQNMEVESSEEIEYKRNKMQNITLDITGKNIKNIQSVHYEPLYQNYNFNPLQESDYKRDLFKNFQKSYNSKEMQTNNFVKNYRVQPKPSHKQQIMKEGSIHNQENKFVSKTFNSYLSGQMRSEYGHAIKQIPKQALNSSFNSKKSDGGYKIMPILKYSPVINKNQQQYINNYSQQCSSRQQNFFHSISSNHQPNQSFNNNKNLNSSKFNQQSHMSLNQSINQQNTQKIQTGVSPRNIHQLESKHKFSINSPMTKIDEMILHEQKLNKQTQITQFNGQSNNHQFNTQHNNQFIKVNYQNQYAISSPIGDYKSNQSFQQKIILGSKNKTYQQKYACAQSIVSNHQSNMQNNIKSGYSISLNEPSYQSHNYILSMQPLKISLQNVLNVQNTKGETKQSSRFSNYSKIAQSHQNTEIKMIDPPKVQAYTKQKISTQNISNGRQFLQSLHQKQSIEIEMSPQNNKHVEQEKASFVAQTFRPTISNNTKPNEQINVSYSSIKKSPLQVHQSNSNIKSNNKISITKITLRSSDKNTVTSPKVISLAINPLSTNRNEPIKQFTLNPYSDSNKQNIFQKLTIKQSKNLQSHNFTINPTDINQSKDKISLSNQLYQSIKNTSLTPVSTQHSYRNDMASKQNNNTMNNSVQKIELKPQNTYKTSENQTLKQSSNQINKQSNSVIQKREPLLKLSKNLGNSIQQSINIKKSVGESIRNKVQPSSSLLNSKTISIGGVKQSLKNVKQSIGNDSDMDFDLQLD